MNVLSRDQADRSPRLPSRDGLRASAPLSASPAFTAVPLRDLALSVGRGCAVLHDRMMRGVRTGRLELG